MKALLRLNSQSVPWRLLLPDLVIRDIWAPAAPPLPAEDVLVSTLNCEMESTEGEKLKVTAS